MRWCPRLLLHAAPVLAGLAAAALGFTGPAEAMCGGNIFLRCPKPAGDGVAKARLKGRPERSGRARPLRQARMRGAGLLAGSGNAAGLHLRRTPVARPDSLLSLLMPTDGDGSAVSHGADMAFARVSLAGRPLVVIGATATSKQ